MYQKLTIGEECEKDMEDMYEETAISYSQPISSVNSVDGWMWIGGLRGEGTSAAEAMKQALENLRCRYACNK